MMHGTYDSGTWLEMAGMMTLMSLLTVLVVVAVVRAARQRSGAPQALHVLDQRYARGEIDSEEYAQRRRLLRDQ